MNALKKMLSMFDTKQKFKLLGMSMIILGGAGMELIALDAFNNFIEAIMLPDSYMDNAFIAMMSNLFGLSGYILFCIHSCGISD